MHYDRDRSTMKIKVARTRSGVYAHLIRHGNRKNNDYVFAPTMNPGTTLAEFKTESEKRWTLSLGMWLGVVGFLWWAKFEVAAFRHAADGFSSPRPSRGGIGNGYRGKGHGSEFCALR